MLSADGQVRLPGAARRALGVKPGDKLHVLIEHDTVRLAPRRRRPTRIVMQRDPVTDLPYFGAPKGTPILTLAAVKQALRDFP